MQQLVTMLLLFNTSKAQVTPPAPCGDSATDSIDCARLVEWSKSDIGDRLTYWVDLVDNKPVFHGNLEHTNTREFGASNNYVNLRLCVEFMNDEI